MSLKAKLSELLPLWMTRKRPGNQTGGSRRQGGSRPSSGANNASGSTGP
jgi:hypothetical protein